METMIRIIFFNFECDLLHKLSPYALDVWVEERTEYGGKKTKKKLDSVREVIVF